jgi:5'-nucleotidase
VEDPERRPEPTSDRPPIEPTQQSGIRSPRGGVSRPLGAPVQARLAQGTIGEEGGSQLVLPIVSLREATRRDVRIPRSERVFVSRNLRMGSVEWLGFDMDYTLVTYNQREMDALSVEVTLKGLIKRGYPEYLREVSFDPLFPIRGLLIDKRLGHVLKMNRFQGIQKGYHGTRELSRDELAENYLHQKIRPEPPRFHWIDTLFGLCEVTSYVALVDALEARGAPINYGRLFSDIRDSIDEAHANGEVHGQVMADLPKFVTKDPYLPQTLHKLRSGGKKLFLLTNSPLAFTEKVLSYLLNDQMPEYRTWQQFFNVVIVSAKKPGWFKGDRPFLELRNGKAQNDVRTLQRGHVYEGGNLRDFERMTRAMGARVLYVGDHIYGDILRSKKDSVWRTAMIIQELDAELSAHRVCAREIQRQIELQEVRGRLEDELRFYQLRLKDLAKEPETAVSSERARVKHAIDQLRRSLVEMNQEQEGLERHVDQAFHPYWGSLLKEQGELSSFGEQVARYSDIYMRAVSSLRHYSPEQFFRSPHDFMPHEL